MKALTFEQHISVLKNLIKIGKNVDIKRIETENISYKSIMICFLLQELSISNSLIRLYDSVNPQYYPSTVGYVMCRSMLEIDINAHYISERPTERSRQYIFYKKVIKKNRMEVCKKHLNTKKEDWKYALNMEWDDCWDDEKETIDREYEEVIGNYSRKTRKGKNIEFSNWSGKSIREMAENVDHLESYDYFYTFLSSFVHGDIEEIDRFLRINQESMIWTLQTDEFDIGNVFSNASTFFHCLLSLFGEKLKIWDKEIVDKCWEV